MNKDRLSLTVISDLVIKWSDWNLSRRDFGHRADFYLGVGLCGGGAFLQLLCLWSLWVISLSSADLRAQSKHLIRLRLPMLGGGENLLSHSRH